VAPTIVSIGPAAISRHSLYTFAYKPPNELVKIADKPLMHGVRVVTRVNGLGQFGAL